VYDVHEALRLLACMHVEISAYLPIMEGSHTSVTQPKSSLGISLLCPGCLRPYPDRQDMCVSMPNPDRRLAKSEMERARDG
jgi:hypothetical protein